MVSKKEVFLRFCVEYRNLNVMTIRNSYPISRMDELIYSLGDADIFITLDANFGYWKIQMDPAARHLTTFTSHVGLYHFPHMPFALKNALATFQLKMDIILAYVRWQFSLVYLDAVIMFSKTIYDCFEHVDPVLQLVRHAIVSQ